MKIEGIDASRIESMLAQLKAAAQRPSVDGLSNLPNMGGTQSTPSPGKINFADALKASLDQVNKVQLDAEKLGKSFAMGDDSVSLSDVMIASQKASISFQTAVQVRNKLVTAYRDMMNMSV